MRRISKFFADHALVFVLIGLGAFITYLFSHKIIETRKIELGLGAHIAQRHHLEGLAAKRGETNEIIDEAGKTGKDVQ